MNLNELASAISRKEGKAKQVNIAQIKEVIKCLGEIFKSIGFIEFAKLAWKIRKNG